MFKNLSVSPLLPQKHCHFRPHPVSIATLTELKTKENDKQSLHHDVVKSQSTIVPSYLEDIAAIAINKDILSETQILKLNKLHEKFHEVFNNDLKKGYNHTAGKFFADFSFTTKPPPTKVFSPQYSKKCADLQQAKCDELEEQGVLVDPKLHDIPILHVSPCWIQQKGRARHKNLQDCSLDELRFITAFNTLNDSIRPKPTSSCSATAIFKFLARWQFHIFGDLNNSYFQLPVKKHLWSYLGVQTPFKGVRVMTRTGQGLLGSDVELGELLSQFHI